jgi:methanethiol S-methyltransferase
VSAPEIRQISQSRGEKLDDRSTDLEAPSFDGRLHADKSAARQSWESGDEICNFGGAGMSRFASFLYGIFAYVLFLGAILYTIGFVGNFRIPQLIEKTIDSGEPGNLGLSVAVDLILLAIFALQHSVMARKDFKHWWTRIIPHAIERSTYVLTADLALILLLWQWRPIPSLIWTVFNPAFAHLLTVLSLGGWVLVFLSTFMISHFDLLGVQQVYDNIRRQPARNMRFQTPFLYKCVRHPLYLGLLVAFWATPAMSMGHLLFSLANTAYIFLGILLEERDLVKDFGRTYIDYQARVSMILPLPPAKE